MLDHDHSNKYIINQEFKRYSTKYYIKIGEIEKKMLDHDHSNKYIINQEFNQLSPESFAARLKQADLVSCQTSIC